MHHWRTDMFELEYAQPQTSPQYNEILVRLYSQRSGNVLYLAPVTPDGDPPASKSAVLGGDSSTMCTSTIERVTRENDAIDTLTWLGSSFFSDIRLARFALETWRQVGSPELVDWIDAGPFASPVVEIWAVRDHAGTILGAMTIHYYSWARMRAQRYFVRSCAEPVNAADCLYIQPFEGLLSGRMEPGKAYNVAVELGYMAVAEPLRGLGFGTQLFEVFLERAQGAPIGRSLAFTIVMSRHAHSRCGQTLMSHMINAGANDPARAVSLRELARPLKLPIDLLDLDPKSRPTARLALRQGFSLAGYGKNLGQVWVRDMQQVARAPHPQATMYPLSSLPPDHLPGSTPMISTMP
ncbi:hypothetical protein BH20CHL4_BH20CHL4_14680 [soil metagenome]